MRNDSADHVAGVSRGSLIAAAGCAAAFILLLQFYGNSTLGYIKSASLWRWWVGQWLDPRAETEHGWLILAISAWLLWRNLRSRELKGSQMAPEQAGSREQETGDRGQGAGRGVRLSPVSCLLPPAGTAAAAMIAGLVLHL